MVEGKFYLTTGGRVVKCIAAGLFITVDDESIVELGDDDIGYEGRREEGMSANQVSLKYRYPSRRLNRLGTPDEARLRLLAQHDGKASFRFSFYLQGWHLGDYEGEVEVDALARLLVQEGVVEKCST